MQKVSHREFTRVKNSFGKKNTHYYTTRPRVCRTPNDNWVNLTWRLNGEPDDLFCIVEDSGKKEYFVSDKAYKILHILEMYGLSEENTDKVCDGISW